MTSNSRGDAIMSGGMLGESIPYCERGLFVHSPSSRLDAGSAIVRNAGAALQRAAVAGRDLAERAMRPQARAIWWPYARMTLIGIAIILLAL
jgi:hypothetical protein